MNKQLIDITAIQSQVENIVNAYGSIEKMEEIADGMELSYVKDVSLLLDALEAETKRAETAEHTTHHALCREEMQKSIAENAKLDRDRWEVRAIRAEADYEKARNHATNLTRCVETLERAIRQQPFACKACVSLNNRTSVFCDGCGCSKGFPLFEFNEALYADEVSL